MNMLSFFPAISSKSRVGTEPITRLRSDIDRIFDEFTSGSRLPAVFSAAESGVLPSLEVQENDKTVTISAELPGIDKEDIDVSVHEQIITISGEKKHSAEKKEDDYFMSERSYGKFKRSLSLPFIVDDEAIEAKYEKGVLTLTVPKPEKAVAQSKRVPVNEA